MYVHSVLDYVHVYSSSMLHVLEYTCTGTAPGEIRKLAGNWRQQGSYTSYTIYPWLFVIKYYHNNIITGHIAILLHASCQLPAGEFGFQDNHSVTKWPPFTWPRINQEDFRFYDFTDFTRVDFTILKPRYSIPVPLLLHQLASLGFHFYIWEFYLPSTRVPVLSTGIAILNKTRVRELHVHTRVNKKK